MSTRPFEGLQLIEGKLRSGQDVFPHLSTRIKSLDYDDYMLNDWDIYHLHLGTSSRSDGFIERTNELLLAWIDPNNAYLIGIYPPGCWTLQELLKIIHNNWPDSIGPYRMNGVIGMAYTFTDSQIGQLRRANLNTMYEVAPGVVYGQLGGGYTASGDSTEVVRRCIYYNRLVKSFEKSIEENEGTIIEEMRKSGMDIPEELHFRLEDCDGLAVAVETSTGFRIQFETRLFES